MAGRLEDLETERGEVLDDIAYVMQIGRLADAGIVRRVAVHGMSEHDPVRRMGIYGNTGILFEDSRNSVHMIEMAVRKKDCTQTEIAPGKVRKQELRILSGVEDERIFADPKDYAVRLICTDRDYLV
jgi:hypothetical protein